MCVYFCVSSHSIAIPYCVLISNIILLEFREHKHQVCVSLSLILKMNNNNFTMIVYRIFSDSNNNQKNVIKSDDNGSDMRDKKASNITDAINGLSAKGNNDQDLHQLNIDETTKNNDDVTDNPLAAVGNVESDNVAIGERTCQFTRGKHRNGMRLQCKSRRPTVLRPQAEKKRVAYTKNVSHYLDDEIITQSCNKEESKNPMHCVSIVVVCPFEPSSSLIQVLRVQKAQFSYRIEGSVP